MARHASRSASFFEQVEKPALGPLPARRFPCFAEAQRIVNRDGHVEVAKAYYSAPPEFVGRSVWARWDGRLVRLFDQQLRQIAIHAQREPGRFATDAAHIAAPKRGGIERGTAWWLNKTHSIGFAAGRWAEQILHRRGVHGVRVLMGLVSLTQRHPVNAIEQACRVAHLTAPIAYATSAICSSARNHRCSRNSSTLSQSIH